jgi:predicted dienelactone hydrolase
VIKKWLFVSVCALLLGGMSAAIAQDDAPVFGDALPGAPELAARGEFAVGVRTLALVNPDQADLLAQLNGTADARYDRELTVEVWYPGVLLADAPALTTYEDTLGLSSAPETLIPFTFAGRAARDADPDPGAAPYPLVIVSHGYPGSRMMFTYLTENLASKGYVVVSIAHTESTFGDVNDFRSTLLNRALDQRFVIDQMAAASEGEGVLNGLVDADNTAIVGYSMGGYGALNVIGAGYNQVLGAFVGPTAAPLLAGDAAHAPDPRVKTAVLFAPFGGDLTVAGAPGASFWDAEALAAITVPTLWIVGSEDDIAIAAAVVNLFDASVNSERYLLTYANALHNVAPNPPPAAAIAFPDYERYAEPVWDEYHINNVNQHFITAFLGQTLKGGDFAAYLQPAVEAAGDGVYSLDEAGEPTADHTYWAGFQPRTALGLSLRAVAGE